MLLYRLLGPARKSNHIAQPSAKEVISYLPVLGHKIVLTRVVLENSVVNAPQCGLLVLISKCKVLLFKRRYLSGKLFFNDCHDVVLEVDDEDAFDRVHLLVHICC